MIDVVPGSWVLCDQQQIWQILKIGCPESLFPGLEIFDKSEFLLVVLFGLDISLKQQDRNVFSRKVFTFLVELVKNKNITQNNS